MGVQVITHVIGLVLHVLAQFVEGRGRDHVALAIHLPGDGGELRADFIVTRSTRGGSSVNGQIGSLVAIDNHTTEEVGVVVFIVIDNSKDLSLDTNLCGSIREDVVLAEDTIIERSLVLEGGAAVSGSRVGPVDFVGGSNLHTNAVLPVVLLGEFFIILVVVLAVESFTDFVVLFGGSSSCCGLKKIK